MNNSEKQYNQYGARTEYDYTASEGRNATTAEDFEQMLYYKTPTNNTAYNTMGRESGRQVSSPVEAPYRDDYTQPSQEENEDLRPSDTTLQFREMKANPLEDYRSDVETSEDRRYQINAKGKILIAVYALVVLTIFTLIALNTRLLKSMDSTISSQQSEIALLKEESEVLSDRFEMVSADSEIEKKAFEFGMIKE